MPLLASAQTPQSPYAGDQSRQIKSLSEVEIEAYLNGRGMGLARAAELNSYPGPMHALELAEQLQLSEAQRRETQRIFNAMRVEAVRLGRQVVEREAELNRLFAGGEVNTRNLQTTAEEIARLQGQLRVAHLRAHLEMRRVLSATQIRMYDELRGYGSNIHDGSRHSGRH